MVSWFTSVGGCVCFLRMSHIMNKLFQHPDLAMAHTRWKHVGMVCVLSVCSRNSLILFRYDIFCGNHTTALTFEFWNEMESFLTLSCNANALTKESYS